MPEKDEHIKTKSYKVQPVVRDPVQNTLRAVEPDDMIDGVEINKADLALSAVNHRKYLFWFIVSFAGVMFIVYIVAFFVLFLGDPSRIKQLCDATSLALIPMSLLIITPVTMVLALLHKLYRMEQKTPDGDLGLPQLDFISKIKDVILDVLKETGLTK